MALSKQSLWGSLVILFANFIIISHSQYHIPRAPAVPGRLHWRALNVTNTTTAALPGTATGTGGGVVIIPTDSSSSKQTSSSTKSSGSSASSSGSSSSGSSSLPSSTNGVSSSKSGTSTASSSASGSRSGSSTASRSSTKSSPAQGSTSSASSSSTGSSSTRSSSSGSGSSGSSSSGAASSTPASSSGASSSGASSSGGSSSGTSTSKSSSSGVSSSGASSSGASSTPGSSSGSGSSTGSSSKPLITTTSSGAGGVVIITEPPSTVTEIPTGTEITTSATDLSVEFVGIFPFITSWAKTPDPPQATKITNMIDDILPKVKDLLDKFPKPEGELDPCGNSKKRDLHSLQKRTFLDGLFKTVFNLVTCIIQNTDKIKDGIIKGTKDTVENTLKDLQPEIDALNKLDPKDNPDNNSPSNSPTKSASSTSSSSGCTASKTVSNCNVQCSATVTSTVAQPGKRADGETSCSSVCEAPVTACTATGTTSRATTTSTVSVIRRCTYECEVCRDNKVVLPDEADIGRFSTSANGHPFKPASTISLKSYETLNARGAVQTAVPKAESRAEKSLTKHMSKDLAKRQLFSPADFNNDNGLFIRTVLAFSTLVPHGAPPISTTANTASLGAISEWHGVVNLYGCTSVIVVSRKRIWLSHIWEGPSFIDPRLLQQDILDPIDQGGQGIAQGISAFTGPGGDFENIPANKVRAFIMTPNRRGVANPLPNDLEFDYEVGKIKDLLKRVLNQPGRDPVVIPYIPLFPDPGFPYIFSHGKVLVQYDPAQRYEVLAGGCQRQVARLEIWAEDAPTYKYRDEWTALHGQVVAPPPAPPAPPGNGNNPRRSIGGLTPRQGGSCPKPPSDDDSTTAEPTSSGSQTSTNPGSSSSSKSGSSSATGSLTTTTKAGSSTTTKPPETSTSSSKPVTVPPITTTSSSIPKTTTTATATPAQPTKPSFICKDGTYKDFNECGANCGVPSAMCSENAGVKGVVCKCPPQPECKNGQYGDFNECSYYCSKPGALCSEKAGIKGVECICP